MLQDHNNYYTQYYITAACLCMYFYFFFHDGHSISCAIVSVMNTAIAEVICCYVVRCWESHYEVLLQTNIGTQPVCLII